MNNDFKPLFFVCVRAILRDVYKTSSINLSIYIMTLSRSRLYKHTLILLRTGGTRRQLGTVIIQLRIVDEIFVLGIDVDGIGSSSSSSRIISHCCCCCTCCASSCCCGCGGHRHGRKNKSFLFGGFLRRHLHRITDVGRTGLPTARNAGFKIFEWRMTRHRQNFCPVDSQYYRTS